MFVGTIASLVSLAVHLSELTRSLTQEFMKDLRIGLSSATICLLMSVVHCIS